jgi:regulator of sigma E protease
LRKTIQIERNGEHIDIEIPKEYISQMIKGKGLISYRIPFYYKNKIQSFEKGSPAKEAGLLKDDEITGIDGLTFDYYDEFQNYLADNAGKPVTLNLLRAGQNETLTVTVNDKGFLGVYLEGNISQIFELKTITYGFFESIPAGIAKGFSTISDYLKQFKLVFSKDTKAYESVGGFITIANIFSGVWDWEIFWGRTAFLSIILAVMNLLPIPALDGGHVMFLIYEVVTGRKPSDKFLENAQIVGMIILFSLLILANGNDILNLIRK